MKTILIVDDEAVLRANLREMLTFEDFNVLEAGDGNEAVHLAIDHLPDLVICDVAMPGLTGYEVLVQLRQSPETAAIPFILLTAQVEKTSIERGLELGAAGYILKPFSFEAVLDKIRAVLAL